VLPRANLRKRLLKTCPEYHRGIRKFSKIFKRFTSFFEYFQSFRTIFQKFSKVFNRFYFTHLT